jgi:class 3 adenylate cyclase
MTDLACINCSVELLPESRFCHRCGRSTARLPQVERRWCTVLFADVRDFSTLSEGLDPEIVQQLMNQLFGRLTTLVERHGGSVDKIIGDAIMALFGVPKASGDDAERAVHCGLAVHTVCAEVADTLGLGLSMRVGINTGEVIAGSLGRASEYTVIGDTVNVASRLEGAAASGQVLVGSSTFHQVRERFELAAVGELSLKGRSQKEQAYLVLGARDRWAGAQPEAGMVGRSADLKRLRDLYQSTRTTRGAVWFSGEQGLGRTRLLASFAEGIKPAPFQLSLDPFVDCPPAELPVRLLSALAGGQAPRMVATETLRQWLGDSADHAPALEQLFDPGIAHNEVALDAALDALDQLSDGGLLPTVIIVDEADRLDPLSLRWLERLLGGPGSGLVVLSSDKRAADLGAPLDSWAALQHFALDPLSEAAVEEWLGGALGAVSGDLVQRFSEVSGGNPAHMRELLRVWRAEGVVRGDAEGRFVLDPLRLQEVAVPGGLRELLQARVDELPRTPRYLLQRCAAVGQVFWHAVAEVVAIGDKAEVDAALIYLVDHNWLTETVDDELPAERAYTFVTRLVAEIAAHMLPLALRRNLHGKVADWLRARGALERPGMRMLLGRHLMLAEEQGRASDLFEQVAVEAMVDGDAAVAVEALGQAVEGAEGDRLTHLSLERAEILWLRQGRVADAAAVLRPLLGSEVLKGALLLRVQVTMAQIALAHGEVDEARGYVDAALVELGPETPESLALYVRHTATEVDLTCGFFDRARRRLAAEPPFVEAQGRGARQHNLLLARLGARAADPGAAHTRLRASIVELADDLPDLDRLEWLHQAAAIALLCGDLLAASEDLAAARLILQSTPSVLFDLQLTVLTANLSRALDPAAPVALEPLAGQARDLGLVPLSLSALELEMGAATDPDQRRAAARSILECSQSAWALPQRCLALAVLAGALDGAGARAFAAEAEAGAAVIAEHPRRLGVLALLAAHGRAADPALVYRARRQARQSLGRGLAPAAAVDLWDVAGNLIGPQ